MPKNPAKASGMPAPIAIEIRSLTYPKIPKPIAVISNNTIAINHRVIHQSHSD